MTIIDESEQSLSEQSLDAGQPQTSRRDDPRAHATARALDKEVERSEPEGEELAARLDEVGQLGLEEGNYADAVKAFRQALEIRERRLGRDHPDIVESCRRLAAAHVANGELESAEPLLYRALSITEAQFGPEHPDTALCLNDLVRLHFRQSAFSKAEPLLLRLLDVTRARGENRPEVATVLASLASVRHWLGRYAAAEQLWRQALEIRESSLTPNHFVTTSTVEHLADTYAAQGRLDEALALLQRALTMREQALGTAHPSAVAARAKIVDLQLLASQEVSPSIAPVSFLLGVTRRPKPVPPIDPIDPPDFDPPDSVLVPAAEAPRPLAPESAPARAVGSASPGHREPRRILVATSSAESRRAQEPEPAPVFAVARRSEPPSAAEDEWDDEDDEQPWPGEDPWLRRQSRRVAAALAVALRNRPLRIVVAVVVISLILLLLIWGTRGARSAAASSGVTVEGPRPGEVISDARASGRSRAASGALAGTAMPGRGGLGAAASELGQTTSAHAATAVGAEHHATQGGTESPRDNRATTRLPTLAPDSPLPAYPSSPRTYAVRGRVLVEFAVSPDGRADASTLRVLSSDDDLLTRAVREALPRMQFIPAEIDGQKVSQRLRVPFTFAPL